MKSLLCAIFTGALLCSMSLAQDTTPSSSTSPQQSPASQAPSNEQSAQPSNSDQQQAPAAQPSSPAQGQSPSRQAPSQEQAARPSNSAPEVAGAKRLAPGSVIPVQLTKSIDAKKVKTGDEVVAKVTQDMKSNSGEVIFAKDTKVLGHVTEAQPRSKEQKESQVGIAFDRAVMKNGSEMQMPMSIQAIIGQQNNNQQNNANASPAPDSSAGTSGSATAGRNSGMGRSASAPAAAGGNPPADEQTAGSGRPQITAETRGVVGMSDLKLEGSGQASAQGSVVTSEKNNVKLDSGTVLLLRVNQ